LTVTLAVTGGGLNDRRQELRHFNKYFRRN